MQEYSRTIKYSRSWILQMTIIVVAGAALCLMLYMVCGIEKSQGLSEIMAVYPGYLTLIGGLFIGVTGYSSMAMMVPLQISYGCTRRSAAFGILFMNIMLAVILLVIAGIWYGLGIGIGVNTFSINTVFAVLDIYLFVLGMSFFEGPIMVKYGKKGYSAIIMICSMVCSVGVSLYTIRMDEIKAFFQANIKVGSMLMLTGALVIWAALGARSLQKVSEKLEVNI